MIVAMGNAEKITDSAVNGFIEQLANIEFTSVLMYAIMMLAAIVICFEGYRFYKLALIVIGFCVGYSRAHLLLGGFGLTDEQMLMAQAVAGILLGLLAGFLVHVGIFIAAYHFAQANLSAILTPILLQHVDVPKLLEPVSTRIVGVLIAAVIAWLAVKAERLVVVIVTAVIGGFAAVNFFLQMIPVLPFDISFFLRLPAVVYVFAKLGISVAGVAVQDVKKK